MANGLPSLILTAAITAYLQSPVRRDRFPGCSLMQAGELRWEAAG